MRYKNGRFLRTLVYNIHTTLNILNAGTQGTTLNKEVTAHELRRSRFT